MVDIGLRPAGTTDEAFLLALYADTRRDEMGLTGWPPKQIEQFLEMQFEAQRRHYTAHYPSAAHDVILVDGVAAGRLWVHRGPDEIRLLDIALRPLFRNRGVATTLIGALQDEARRNGVPLRHSVVKENTGALRLYERLGFHITGEIPTHHQMEWAGP